MTARTTKHVLLLLARDFAEHAAMPIFLVDSTGALVFFNEPAEGLLGRRFSDVGEMSAQEWGSDWEPEDPQTGEALPLDQLPLGIAFQERRPASQSFGITSGQGARQVIDVVAFPLIDGKDSFVGAAAIFWPHDEATPPS